MNTRVQVCTLIVLTFCLLIAGQTRAGDTDLVWSTFLGASDDENGSGIAVDDSGAVYVTGYTNSSNFPSTTGAFDSGYNGSRDVFVAKLNTTGSALAYATFLGGSNEEWGEVLAVDDSGNAHVSGYTYSADFPTTIGAFDESHNGELDVYVTKLNTTGSDLVYSTLLGGSLNDRGYGIDLDDSAHAYVAGYTFSTDFPTTAGAFDESHNGGADAFVFKLNATGNILGYSTFLGGGDHDYGRSLALGDSRNAHVTGETRSVDFPVTAGVYDSGHNGSADVFVVKINATGGALEYATFVGGNGGEVSNDMAVDGLGNAYLTGFTVSTDFPTTVGAFDETMGGGSDAFVVKLNPTGSDLEYGTFLGGGVTDQGFGIAVNGAGHACVTGITTSEDFPTTVGAFDRTHGDQTDVFVTKINSMGSDLAYSTFLGGDDGNAGFRIAVDDSDRVFVCGNSESPEFPITLGVFDESHNGMRDVFVAKLDLGESPVSVEPVTSTGVLPKSYVLHQNYPNPFNANTQIRYQIPEDGHVSVKIFNTLGQGVRTLVDMVQEANEYAVVWNGRDDLDRELASGIYFCRLRAGDYEKTIKMMLVK